MRLDAHARRRRTAGSCRRRSRLAGRASSRRRRRRAERAGRSGRRGSPSGSRARGRGGRRGRRSPPPRAACRAVAPLGRALPRGGARGCGSTRRSRAPARGGRRSRGARAASRSPWRSRPKRNVSPAATTSAPMPRRMRSAKSVGSSAQAFRRNRDDDVVDSRRLEQLQPPLERREELDLPPKHRPRMRIERHDRRPQPRRPRSVDHPHVAEVHAVERPHRDAPRRVLQVVDDADDVHARPRASSDARTSPR